MRILILSTSAILLAACSSSSTNETLSSDQALEAVNETSSNNQASQLASASIDVATRFTFGQNPQQTLTQIASFVASQLPCASVSISGATLSIIYGAYGGNCTFDGLTFAGVHTVSIESMSESAVKIDHAWSNLTNGIVTINGVAQVTWSETDATRTVATNITWTRSWDGMKGQGSANVTQSAIDGDMTGIVENGTRTWTDAAGEWSVSIATVQERWIDPLPQSGSFTLTTSSGQAAVVTFSRLNATTIAASVKSGASTFTFDVSEAGQTAQ